jgi:Lon protease-like protein
LITRLLMRLRSPAPTLPLLPLQAVLFPGGLLSLKVFEARYLDLVSSSLRERTPFGVVALRQATEPGQAVDPNAFEPIGVAAELLEVDAAQAGILHVRARGLHRFELTGQTLGAQGLWEATYRDLPDDVAVAPTDAQIDTVRGLANAIGTLKQQGSEPFLKPFRFEDAGWVANRWCEILPISVAAKQRLMALDDPAARLQLVDDFLRSKGVVK